MVGDGSGRRLGRLGCGVVATSAVVSVVAVFLADRLTPCQECDSGNPDADAMNGLALAFVGVAAFVGSLILISLVVMTVHLWRTRPDEPEWP